MSTGQRERVAMTRCCKGPSPECAMCRLSHGHFQIGIYKDFVDDDFGSAAYLNTGSSDFYLPYLDEAIRSYPDFNGVSSRQHAADMASMTSLLKATAHELASSELDVQDKILRYYRNMYVTGPVARASRDALAYSLRAWLPFVSRSPFVLLDDGIDAARWKSELPQGPKAPVLVESEEVYEDYDVDYAVDGASESIVEQGRPAYEQGRGLRYVPWRSVPANASADDPLSLALASVPHVANGAHLRRHLYEIDPVLLLIPQVADPPDIVWILMSDSNTRDSLLLDLVTRATADLEKGHLAFKREIVKSTPDWGTLQPLLAMASAVLVHSYPPQKNIEAVFDELISELNPWSLRDTINVVAIVASVAIVIGSMGTALPTGIALAAGIGVDAVALGLNAHLINIENLRRQRLNAFAGIDNALSIAAPQMNVTREVVMLAATYAIGPLIGGGLQLSRRVLLRRAIARAGLPAPRVVAAGATKTIPATAPPPRPTAQQRLTNRDSAFTGGDKALTKGHAATPPRPLTTPPVSTTPRPVAGRRPADPRSDARSFEGRPAGTPPGPRIEPHPGFDEAFREVDQPIRTIRGQATTRAGFLLGPKQHEVIEGVLGQQLRKPPRPVGAGRAAPQAAELTNARTTGDRIRRRIADHWDAASPNNGRMSAEDAADEVLSRIWTEQPPNPNQFVREKLFDLWRARAMTAIKADTELVTDLKEHAGIIVAFRPKRGAQSLRLRGRHVDGTKAHTWLDFDHAGIRLEDAVQAAVRANDPAPLVRLIKAQELQLLTERENRLTIEALRKALKQLTGF